MQILRFEALFHSEFFISEAFAKYQDWYHRNNQYLSLQYPKPSHTFLWFKNCRGRITGSDGSVLEVPRGALTYMAKGIRYRVDFFDTNPDKPDTLVVHFQLRGPRGEDITPLDRPEICLEEVDAALGFSLDLLAKDFRRGVVCVPETNAVTYRIFGKICRLRREASAVDKFSLIKQGIDLLEMDSQISVKELAAKCGVSECYFRLLFREYSGMSPMEYRQKNRIDKAKRLLLNENMTTEELSQELGFCDVYHFSRTFKQVAGISPRAFLKAAQEEVRRSELLEEPEH